jgi:hypothetical protein
MNKGELGEVSINTLASILEPNNDTTVSINISPMSITNVGVSSDTSGLAAMNDRHVEL